MSTNLLQQVGRNKLVYFTQPKLHDHRLGIQDESSWKIVDILLAYARQNLSDISSTSSDAHAACQTKPPSLINLPRVVDRLL